jgi:predicted ATP-binding protein involved in virulence
VKIKSFKIENIGRFSDLEINFSEDNKIHNHVLLIGNNGSGKTTILESIALSLSWFVARVKNEKSNGLPINELKVKNNSKSGNIKIIVNDNDEDFTWTLSKAKKGRKNDTPTNLEGLNRLVDIYRTNYTNDDLTSFPILTYYDANRGVLDIPLRIRTKHNFEQLNGYDTSLKGLVDYRTFFEWFRQREDIENEDKIKFIDSLSSNNKSTFHILEEINNVSDKQLNCVRKALSTFLPEFTDIRVERKPRIHMAVNKNGEKLNIEQLSQGEKLTMAMVGDIARRLTILYPSLENPLLGEGIIIIDEAELHMHPRWQRNLVERLNETFPNCQFIYTTHSPLLISDFKDVKCYSINNEELIPINQMYGLDVNQVLLEAMDTEVRNTTVQNIVDDFRDSVSSRNLINSENLLNQLNLLLPENHIELIKSRLLFRKLQILDEKNR